MDPAIRIKNVAHRFGEEGEARNVRALLDTSFDIARGELLCLIGPSGCGKSTLLNMGAGLDPASSGQVWVDGELVTRPNRHVAFMLQKDLLLPWRTIVENVELGQVVRILRRDERREQRGENDRAEEDERGKRDAIAREAREQLLRG